MKAQWIILIAVGAVLVLGLVVYMLMRRGPDLSSYLPLKEPRIVSKPDERVLEVQFDGPADKVIPEAFAVLFKSYYRLRGLPKGPGMGAPKARYAKESFGDDLSPKGLKSRDWKGSMAIPIPEGVAVPFPGAGAAGPVALEGRWEYGDTGEILHLGSYETEKTAIDRLLALAAEKGYEPIGGHEEEYLRGPGMGKIAPEDYWTIIRFRLQKTR